MLTEEKKMSPFLEKRNSRAVRYSYSVVALASFFGQSKETSITLVVFGLEVQNVNNSATEMCAMHIIVLNS